MKKWAWDSTDAHSSLVPVLECEGLYFTTAVHGNQGLNVRAEQMKMPCLQ